jgi:hypothetical protein
MSAHQVIDIDGFGLDAQATAVSWFGSQGTHLDDRARDLLAQLENFFSKVGKVQLGETKPLNAAFQQFDGRIRRKWGQNQSVTPVEKATKLIDSGFHSIAHQQINRRIAHPKQFFDRMCKRRKMVKEDTVSHDDSLVGVGTLQFSQWQRMMLGPRCPPRRLSFQRNGAGNKGPH